MRIHRLLSLALVLTLTLSVSAKVRCLPIYAFGVSASFTDSVVYMTHIQIIDSAWVDDKTHFLLNRSSYSNQLRSYLQGRGEGTRTCIISCATSEKKIQKKYDRIRRKFLYKKKKQRSSYDVKDLGSDEFKFATVRPDLQEETVVVDEKAAKKAAKVREKQAKKAAKEGEKPKEGIETEDGENLPTLPPRT